MSGRVAEHVVRAEGSGEEIRFRVDLHGVSVFGPGDAHTLIRFEWVDTITVEAAGVPGQQTGVVVRSATEAIRFPSGAFNLDAADLAHRLEEARSIHQRPDVIGQLTAR